MKSKKRIPKRKRNLRNKKTRGGSNQNEGSQRGYNANEGSQSLVENSYRPSSKGYPKGRGANNTRKDAKPLVQENTEYNADVDEPEDIDQDYEDYQDYIEELTEVLGEGCRTTTLLKKLESIHTEIAHASEYYDMLISTIAHETLGKYLFSTPPVSNEELEAWRRNASRRASEFQRITIADLHMAFLYLLPTFDASKKYLILSNEDEDTSMHTMIKKYAHKLITALFTRSNITYAVIQYNPIETPYQFMENLLGVMRSASRITNGYMTEHWPQFMWPEFRDIPMEQCMYVHSGGNMTVMIAGMICYLYEVGVTEHYQKGYGLGILEDIRRDFEAYLTPEGVGIFYAELVGRMQSDDAYRMNIKTITEKISDIDLIFMGPDNLVDNIHNPSLKRMNDLTAFVLRKIVVTAHTDRADPVTKMAKDILPFAGTYSKEHWSRFKFSNMSGITTKTVTDMRKSQNPKVEYLGYRQTSNLVQEVPMFLNRLKQGYRPFFELDLSRMPQELQYEYSSKYGECLDCSIGVKTNPLYDHKQTNYMKGNYYSFDTVISEFVEILKGPVDDKTEKRTQRLRLLQSIQTPIMDTLFLIIGRHIS